MKKVRKNLARKILCGLLAAGVVGAGGSALAQSSVSSISANDHQEVGTKPLSQTKEGLEFEFFLKFQSFYFA